MMGPHEIYVHVTSIKQIKFFNILLEGYFSGFLSKTGYFFLMVVKGFVIKNFFGPS